MILIQEILVSRAVMQEQFVCHLERCKGACCIEGDYGAPLADDEIPVLRQELDHIRPFMDPMGIKAVDEKGVFEKFGEASSKGVTLREDAACAFVRIDTAGIAHCTIEEAWKAGATHFRKPISCHLYPIRMRKSEIGEYDAMNYDEWSVCSPACKHGKALQVPLYQFVREAIIRKYGQEFYDELDDIAQAMSESESENVRQ